MQQVMQYQPEGSLLYTLQNKRFTADAAGLAEAARRGMILEGRVSVCDSAHNLLIDLPCMQGMIPREEGAIGIDSGETRDIALISRVNKPVCFLVMGIRKNEQGQEVAILSRRAAQERCRAEYLSRLRPGDIIPATVTHLAAFGCFVDVGCGIPSLIPIDAVSVSRISHPSDRFTAGQRIHVIYKGLERGKIQLSHKELLGTWEENAAGYCVGETVSGIVRSVEDYGVFVELTPNLAGLAEPRPNVKAGQKASVYIKAILPERMKIKLVLVDVFSGDTPPSPLRYWLDTGHLDHWDYAPAGCGRQMSSVFC